MTRQLHLPVQLALAADNELGESPLWSAAEQALYWVDILGRRVLRWHPASGARAQWAMPCEVGSIGLRARGGLVLALRSGLHGFDLASGRLELLAHPEADRPTNRFNDGKVSPDGRFWAGTMDDRPDKEPVASLYRLDADRRCTAMVGGLKVSNGLAWSPDGRTLYHSDSRAGAIFRHAHDPRSGELGERELFVRMQPEWGRPDGAAVDDEGCYWSCGVGAGRLNRFSPDGELMGWVAMPVPHPTMPCFGGPNGRTLYITTHREQYSAEDRARHPQAGALFMLRPGIGGAPAAQFEG